MNNTSLRFVSDAKSDDETRKGLQYVLLDPSRKAILASDGFRLHAIKSNISVACIAEIAEVNHQQELILRGESNVYPNIDQVFKRLGNVAGNITINVAFLLPILEAIKTGDARLVIRKSKEGEPCDIIEVFGNIDGNDAYAIIMGKRGGENEAAWSPSLENANVSNEKP